MIDLPNFLIVEDDKPSMEILKVFSSGLIKPDAVSTGMQAVDKAKSNNYDAIIMDINLGPGMSGLEAIVEIRKTPGYENTPILALTAYAMLGDREKFLKSGCTHYLSKPYTKDQLIEQIKMMV